MDVEDYSEQEITDLIASALSLDGSNKLFPSSGMHLGFAESSLFELLANKLQNKFAHSELNSFLQELRDDLLSNKVPYDIKNLHTQVINCRKCKNFTPNPVLPMWNNQDPDIIFVLDYPIYNKEVAEFFLDTLKSSIGLLIRHIYGWIIVFFCCGCWAKVVGAVEIGTEEV